MSPNPYSPDNVLVVSFGADAGERRERLPGADRPQQLDSQGQIKIAGSAVVTRDLDGGVDIKSEVGEDPYIGTASGGLIGLLVGIIGGPLGVLLAVPPERSSDRSSTSTTSTRPSRS